jgi:hypothetical protein
MRLSVASQGSRDPIERFLTQCGGSPPDRHVLKRGKAAGRDQFLIPFGCVKRYADLFTDSRDRLPAQKHLTGSHADLDAGQLGILRRHLGQRLRLSLLYLKRAPIGMSLVGQSKGRGGSD